MSDKITKTQIVLYRVIKCFARIFCYCIFRMKISGLENIPRKGSFLLLANHQSYLDPILLTVPIHRRLQFVARDSLFKGIIMKSLLKGCLAIPIKRGKADTKAIKTILRTLKQGHGVGLFPEATRTLDGRIIDIKAGFGLLVRKSKTVVIPAIIDGAYESWPKGRKIMLPGEIHIHYGKAITYQQTREMDDKTFAGFLTDELRQMQNICRKQAGKKPYNYTTVNPDKEYK